MTLAHFSMARIEHPTPSQTHGLWGKVFEHFLVLTTQLLSASLKVLD